MNRPESKTETRTLSQSRLQGLWLITVLLFVALILRLGWIQLGSGDKYHRLSVENNFKQIPIPAPRGKILDRNGVPLAENRSLFTAIYLEPELPRERKLATAKELSKTLQMPVHEVLEAMDVGMDASGKSVPRKMPPYYPKKIKNGLTPEEVVRISEDPGRFPGVNVFAEPLRRYRDDRIAVQTIGYVRPFAGARESLDPYRSAPRFPETNGYLDWEQVGVDGLEYTYQSVLRGINGYRLIRVNSHGRQVEVLKEVPSRPGKDLVISLDSVMQSETEEFIARHLEQLRNRTDRQRAPHARNAYAVAMEVKTGNILAMVSHPDYDPNVWNGRVTPEVYKNLSYVMRNGTIREAPYDAREEADPEKEMLRHPFSVVPAGSTVKPLTVLFGLKKGLINEDTLWNDPGAFTYAKATPPVRNSGGHRYGLLGPVKAIQKSSNTFMAWIGTSWYHQEKNEAVREFNRWSRAFGLGVKTGVDLPGEQDGTEDYLSIARKHSGLGAMALASFGQAQRHTALQLAQYTATLANRGTRMRPRLALQAVDPNTGQTVRYEPEVLGKFPMEPSHWRTVLDGMVAVTKPGGTAGHLFKDLPFPVAAKTGTSEQDIPGRGRVENSVFIAFAPAYDPEIAVAVVVPEGGYGAVAAGPIAEKMIGLWHERFNR
ncbi:peptidoglycan D,D-transpeptidase FtsI family protein [Staphylospora marina]|uniref:peptidoglycan D,D-transpeptidase FtsI family protein n=1 Tax=Staphylospora marina TaxID=2490858 RepID=UPI0013DDC5E0|nr:penicillin-binding transpeptidase domain-containing protein [Staphylospora marina]